MKIAKVWGLWIAANLSVVTAECLQFIGLYIESRAPLVLATACLDRIDELCGE